MAVTASPLPGRSENSPGGPKAKRDTRVDLVRGLALLTIFVDHVPGNALGLATLRNFGFADAAELFVFFAGFSAMAAYGRVFERDGLRAGILKIAARCVKLYGFQVALLLGTLFTVTWWTRAYGMESLFFGPILRDGLAGALRGLTLQALPAYLDILPLYLALLAIFPLVYLGLRAHPRLTLLGSFAVYMLVNYLQFNLSNVVDPDDATEWQFNPFAWQLIFVLGAIFAQAAKGAGGTLTRSTPLAALCWIFIAFSLAMATPWNLWSRPFDETFPFEFFDNNPKAFLTPWRLADACAIVYLALTSPFLARLSTHRATAWMATCGRHSLEVFALGSILALFGRLTFRTLGTDWYVQLFVNILGLALMLLLAILLDRSKQAPGRFMHRLTRMLVPRFGTTELAKPEKL